MISRSASPIISGPEGQPGDVRVMSTVTFRSVNVDAVDEPEIHDVELKIGILHAAQRELYLVLAHHARGLRLGRRASSAWGSSVIL